MRSWSDINTRAIRAEDTVDRVNRALNGIYFETSALEGARGLKKTPII